MNWPASNPRFVARLSCLLVAALLQAADAQSPEPGPPPAPPAPAASEQAAPPSRADAYAEFRRLFDAKSYEQAAVQAQRVVELTEKESGTKGDDLQAAVMNLATAQYLSGDYIGAETSYLRVIQLAEADGRPLSTRLARANAGLAATYYAGKRYDLAVTRFEQALAMNRRNEGLLNEQQLPMLEKYADALTQLGRYQDALQVQEYALRIATRKYGDDDPRIAPTLEKIGRWYAQVGAYDAARAIIKRSIRLIEAAHGENSPALVGPLTALAECDRRQLLDPAAQSDASPDSDRSSMFRDSWTPIPYSSSITAGEGQQALERAVQIASNQPQPSRAQVADVRTQLGDWFSIRMQPDQALPQYQQAWLAATGVNLSGKPLTTALFDQPVLLYYQRPENWNRYANKPRDQIEVHTVRIDLTVTEQGRVKDARVVDDAGDARMGEQSLRAAGTARYRPRLVNGQPSATENVHFAQPWIVLVKAPEPAPQAKPATVSPARPAPSGQ